MLGRSNLVRNKTFRMAPEKAEIEFEEQIPKSVTGKRAESP